MFLSQTSGLAAQAHVNPPSVIGTNIPSSGERAMAQHLGRVTQNPGMQGQKPFHNENIAYMQSPASTDPWGGSKQIGGMSDNGTFSQYVLLDRVFAAEGEEAAMIGPNGICPLISTNFDVITIREGRFNVAMPTRWAPRGQTHGTSYQFESELFTLTDWAIGFEFALKLLEDPDGAEILRMSIEQLNLGVKDHLIMTAYKAILEYPDWAARSWVTELQEQNQLGFYSAEQWMMRDIKQLGFLQGSGTPMEDLKQFLNEIVRPYANGIPNRPNVLIVNQEIGKFLIKVPAYSRYLLGGERAVDFRGSDPATALSRVMDGYTIHMVQPSLVNGRNVFDILNGRYRIGYFAQMAYESSSTTDGTRYITDQRNIRIFDGEYDDFRELKFERGLLHSGRWSNTDGDDYLRAIDLSVQAAAGFRDLFYTELDANQNLHMLHRLMIQQRTEHVPLEIIQDIALSAIDGMDDLAAREKNGGSMSSAIRDLLEAKRVMEETEYTNNVDLWIGALVARNAANGTTPSHTLPNVEILRSNIRAPLATAPPAGAVDWTSGGTSIWQLPPFCATGPALRMIRDTMNVVIPTANTYDNTFGWVQSAAKMVSTAYTLAEELARYVNAQFPHSAAVNPAYTSPNMEKNYTDTLIDNLLGNYRAPVYAYFGRRANGKPIGANAGGVQLTAGTAIAEKSATLGISAPRRATLQQNFVGTVVEESSGRPAGAQADIIQGARANVRINADFTSLAARSRTIRVLLREGIDLPFSGTASEGKPIATSTVGGVISDVTTASGIRILKLISNYIFVDSAEREASIRTEKVRALIFAILSLVDVSSGPAVTNERLDTFFEILGRVDAGSVLAAIDNANAGPIDLISAPSVNAVREIFSDAFFTALKNTRTPSGIAIFPANVSIRRFGREGTAITDTAAAFESSSADPAQVQAVQTWFDTTLARSSAIGGGDEVVGDVSESMRYVMLPLTYSPEQLRSYAMAITPDPTGVAARASTFNVALADPEDFSQRMSLARIIDLAGRTDETMPETLKTRVDYDNYQRIPSIVVGEQMFPSNGLDAVDMQDSTAPPPAINERDRYLPFVFAGDKNAQNQWKTIGSISSLFQRIIARAWALTAPRWSSIQTWLRKNIRIPFTVLAMRPEVILQTTGIVACQRGGQNTVFSHPIGTYGQNATQQIINGVLSWSSGAFVTARRSIIHLRHLLITGCESGLDTRTAYGGPEGTAAAYAGQNSNGMHASANQRGAIHFLVEPAVFNYGAGYNQIICGFGNWGTLQRNNGTSFSNDPDAAHFFSVAWFKSWFHIEDSENSYSDPETVALEGPKEINNMAMFSETIIAFNPTTRAFEPKIGGPGPIPASDWRAGLIKSWRTLTPMSAFPVTLV